MYMDVHNPTTPKYECMWVCMSVLWFIRVYIWVYLGVHGCIWMYMGGRVATWPPWLHVSDVADARWGLKSVPAPRASPSSSRSWSSSLKFGSPSGTLTIGVGIWWHYVRWVDTHGNDVAPSCWPTWPKLTIGDGGGGCIGHLVELVWGGMRSHCNARVMMSRHVQQPKDLPNTSHLDPKNFSQTQCWIILSSSFWQLYSPLVKLRDVTALGFSTVRCSISHPTLIPSSSIQPTIAPLFLSSYGFGPGKVCGIEKEWMLSLAQCPEHTMYSCTLDNAH